MAHQQLEEVLDRKIRQIRRFLPYDSDFMHTHLVRIHDINLPMPKHDARGTIVLTTFIITTSARKGISSRITAL